MANFSGGPGNETYSGSSYGDLISGGDGADRLKGSFGDDFIASAARSGGFGQTGYASLVSLDSGTEVDTLIGDAGNDHLFAGYGDNVDGGTHDSYDGDALSLSLLGASAGVVADFSQAVVTIGGGTIRNIESLTWLQGSNFGDTIIAGDLLTGGFGAILGMGGNDSITGGYYTTVVDGGSGNDRLYLRNCQYIREIHGGRGNDVIYGPGNSIAPVYGDAGNDIIYGADSSSECHGGTGDDHLYTVALSDGAYLLGEDGDDTIDGSEGSRTVGFGGAGRDLLIGGRFGDELCTDIRPDYLPTRLYDDLAADRDVVRAGAGDDIIAAGWGDTVAGGNGTDSLRLSLAGGALATGQGMTLSLAQVIAADGTAIGGGRITGIEVLDYVGTTNFADVVRVTAKATARSLGTLGGNDTIYSDGTAITVLGGEGDDRYAATASGGLFDGGAGFDRADFGKAAAKVAVQMAESGDAGLIAGVALLFDVEDVAGSAFNDRITGNSADNLIKGNAGDDQLIGGYGNDTLDGGAGVDRLDGGQGDDTYVVGDGADKIIEAPGGGFDTVRAATSFALAAEIEVLVLTGAAAADGTGNGADNLLTGNTAANVLKGLGGNDVLDGKGGADRLDGGAGDDIYVFTSFGDHTQAEIADSGTGGRDEVRIAAGTAGTFTAFAGERGIERIVVGTGADRSGTQAINVNAAALTSGAVIIGNAGDNSLTGTGGDDLIGGGLGRDTLAGGNGADTLFGEDGSDSLNGGAGADLLYGGAGTDTLTGGLGVDTFAIGTDFPEGVDRITDFASGTDKLLVINAYLSGLLLSGGLRYGTAAQDSDDLAIYDKASGYLYVDYDANGPQAQVLLASFTPGTNLAASDILLIDTGSFLTQTQAAQAELLL